MPELNFQNRTLYHGDNLGFLRGMNSETVHLIATDPPFNKNRDFHATPDSLAKGARFEDRWNWDKDVHEEWVDAIKDNWSGVWASIEAARITYGQDMAAFLCWLGVRLLEMHRILKPTGSLYLHIDSTAHAYTKTLMDAIFGRSNFQGEITWRRTSAHSDSKRFGSVTDTLLYYSKSSKRTWNPIQVAHDPKYVADFYRHEDERGRYRLHEIIRTASMGPRPNLAYEYKGFTPPWGWRMERSKLEALDADNRLVWSNTGRPYRKTYLTDGQPPTNLWDDIPNVAGISREATGYPTQKPLALYERIIKASSNEGDVVLDPFCGCATTPVAAERLGRQWVGMDIWDGAYQIVLDRLESEGLAVPEAADIQDGQQSLTFNHITYSQSPPSRTDADEIPVPNLRLKIQRPKEPWERLTNREIRAILVKAQAVGDLIGCAGCGRTLEAEFMELDHIQPKAENGPDHLLNRILLCRPCNGRKSNQLTMAGLRRQNRQANWTRDANLAEQTQQNALLRATLVRDNWPAWEYR